MLKNSHTIALDGLKVTPMAKPRGFKKVDSTKTVSNGASSSEVKGTRRVFTFLVYLKC